MIRRLFSCSLPRSLAHLSLTLPSTMSTTSNVALLAREFTEADTDTLRSVLAECRGNVDGARDLLRQMFGSSDTNDNSADATSTSHSSIEESGFLDGSLMLRESGGLNSSLGSCERARGVERREQRD